MTGPFLTLALLIAGAVITLFPARSRPRHINAVAPLVAAAASVVWFLVGTQLPLTLVSADLPGLGAGLSLIWSIDRAAWQTSLFLLLLLTSVLLMEAGAGGAKRGISKASSFVLAAGGLLALWADSAAALLISWALLGLLWAFALAALGINKPERLMRALAVSWVGLLLAALGAANLPAPASILDSVEGAWPMISALLLIAAAAWQLWLAPLYAWRTVGEVAPPASIVLVFSAPAAAGSLLLHRLIESGAITHSLGLLLTLVGLAALIWALGRAWTMLDAPGALSKALWFGGAGFLLLLIGTQSGTIVLQGIWVWLLAGGVFLLMPSLPSTGSRSHQIALRAASLAGPIVAVGALAGFPLTAGFAARSGAYVAWAESGNWLSLAAAALLSMPLIAVALATVWFGATGREEVDDAGWSPWRMAAAHLALINPALFLLTPGGLENVSFWTVLVILLGMAGGVALFLFRDRASDTYQAALSMLPTAELPTLPIDGLRRVWSQGVLLLHQAAAILEGEWGFLWLLLLLAAVLLLR